MIDAIYRYSNRYGGRKFGAAIKARSALVEAGGIVAARLAAQRLKDQIVENIGGLEGAPDYEDGDLARSWSVRQIASARGVTSYSVLSTDPATHRLEFGFGPLAIGTGDTSGVDSLGRNYNQRPFPFIAPAIDQANAAIVADFTGAFKGL